MKPELYGASASIDDAIKKTNDEISLFERMLKEEPEDTPRDIESTLLNLRKVRMYLDQAATFYTQAYPDEVLNE